jgi:intracellular septation protein
MVTTVMALTFALVREKRIPAFSLIASGFVLVSGAATLFTHDPYWVALEYTLYNLSFGIAMFVGYAIDTPVLKLLFGTMFSITEKGWHRLSLRWGIFFLLTALGSELFWRLGSADMWLYYRFIMTAVLCLFGFSQFFLTRTERLPESSPWGLRI